MLPPQEHVCHLFAGSAALAAQLLLAATVVISLLYKRCGLARKTSHVHDGALRPSLQSLLDLLSSAATAAAEELPALYSPNGFQVAFHPSCRRNEFPQRPLLVWCLDTSKQGVSSVAAHVCGMLLALLAHSSTATVGTSECSWCASHPNLFRSNNTLGTWL